MRILFIMRLRIDTEPEYGTTYDELLAFASLAEQLGFDGFFCADHYGYATPTHRPPGPLDAWTTLAGLARDTQRLRIGTLVTPVTFRLPAPFALIVAQVDRMSGGRVEVGLGAGHTEGEHTAHGIPFPPIGERFDRLREQLEIMIGLWRAPKGERFSYTGEHTTLVDNPGLPKPYQQPHPPIILGGRGAKRTPALAAGYADELNVSYLSPADTADAFERARVACRAIGRDPTTLRLTTTQLLACGTTDRAVQRRLERVHVPCGTVLMHAAVGSPPVVVERLRRLAEVGAETVYLHCWDPTDGDLLRLVADEVAPALGSLG
jgi:F420-dependent oxidoreductase-like protein